MANRLATPVVYSHLERTGVYSARASGTIFPQEDLPWSNRFPVLRLLASARVHFVYAGAPSTGSTWSVSATFGLGVYRAGNWNLEDQPLLSAASALGQIVQTGARRTWAPVTYATFPTAERLWELVGLSSSPRAGTEYDLAWSQVALGAIGSGGTLVTGLYYTLGD
jgi:hypothetical protein